MTKKWWMESVGYQIYPKSFFDSNHDGIGDLKGIDLKLDYLADLGVNLIWICPFYDSPMDDNGYDVRNFFDVAKEFGTMDDVKELIKHAHERGIKVILDYVLNHTSDEHPWFIESRKSVDNPYRDYYIWHDGRYRDGKKVEPTNWGAFFGGSCWNYDETTDSYYMKIFSNKMPDLNWQNEKVQDEMINIAKTWLELGIDGFRIDAVSHLDRAPFEDSELCASDQVCLDWHKFSNLPKVHDYLKRLNKEVFKPFEALTIGEVGGEASVEQGIKYAAFDSNELSMVFNFDHNWCNNLSEVLSHKKKKVRLDCIKRAFGKWQEAFEEIGWLPLNWLNHDQPRLMTQYGNHNYPKASGKMLATALHMMRGTPFIYQGEEIGMTNFPFEDVGQFNDLSSKANFYYYLNKEPDNPVKALKKAAAVSRDNPRTPMQWDKSPFAGFTTYLPWMYVNPNYKTINVEAQMKDIDSLWHHYKKLIELRRSSIYKETIIYGSYEMIDKEHPDLYNYLRKSKDETLLVINSFSNKKITYDLSKYHIIETVISNYPDLKIKRNMLELKPFASVVYKIEENL